MALQLKRQGIDRVRPLHGGLDLWMDRKFPTMELKLASGEPDLESPNGAIPWRRTRQKKED